MLEIIGLLFRGTNTFQLGLGIMLIILSLKDIGVSNLRWILEVIDFAAKPETLVRGFQACGLYPLNANVVDYTKYLGKNTTRPTNEKIGRQDPSTIQRNEDTSMDYATFVNIVGKEKVEKFRRMTDIISQENNEEFFTLFRL